MVLSKNSFQKIDKNSPYKYVVNMCQISMLNALNKIRSMPGLFMRNFERLVDIYIQSGKENSRIR